jgi:hypothetical protein
MRTTCRTTTVAVSRALRLVISDPGRRHAGPPTNLQSTTMQAQSNSRKLAERERDLLACSELPEPDTQRWTPTRKAQIVLALRSGLLTFDEACKRYGLAAEELACWERSFVWGGRRGLTRAGMRQRRIAIPGPDQE